MPNSHNQITSVVRTLCIVIMGAIVAGAALAAELEGTSTSSSDGSPVDVHDPLEQLHHLLRLAPNRQIGTGGNDAVDRLIEQRFAAAVVRQNEPNRADESDQLVARAKTVEQVLLEAALTGQVVSDQDVMTSSVVVRFTLESPGLVVAALVLVAGVFLLAWFTSITDLPPRDLPP